MEIIHPVNRGTRIVFNKDIVAVGKVMYITKAGYETYLSQQKGEAPSLRVFWRNAPGFPVLILVSKEKWVLKKLQKQLDAW